MGTTNNSGFLTTGDVVVDGVLRALNLSQKDATGAFRALSRAVLVCSLDEVGDETADMAMARQWMRDGALIFEREAVKQARAGDAA